MIEKDLLAEDTIIDGSLFHNCARELEYDSTSSSMEHIRNSWHLIEKDKVLPAFVILKIFITYGIRKGVSMYDPSRKNIR